MTAAEVAAIFSRYGYTGKTQADYERIAYQVATGQRTVADVELWARHLAAGTTPTAAELAAVGTTNTAVYQAQPVSPTQDLNSIPEGDQAQVWLDSNTGGYFLVYYVPGTQVPIMYFATGAEVQSFFGPGQPITVHRVGTRATFDALGALIGGRVTELSNLTENPFDAWASAMEDQAAVRPWLREPEFASLLVEALLEGRELSDAEMQQTEWWRTHNEAERQWMLLSEADPSEARRLIEQNTIIVEDSLRRAGMEGANSGLIYFMAEAFTSGRWDSAYLQYQIRAAADPYSGLKIDPGLASYLSDPTAGGRTKAQEDTVRELVARWMGPAFGAWPEQQVAYWGGRLRNDPDAEQELIEILQNQRLVIFPEYTDRNATYEDIAGPWRTFWRQQWGETVDETDPLFHTVMRMNDAAEAAKLLRGEGLKRGNKTIVGDVLRSVGEASGGGVRRAIT